MSVPDALTSGSVVDWFVITPKVPTMQRVRRGKTIGNNYTMEAIIKRIKSGAEYGKNITFVNTIELHTRRTAKENIAANLKATIDELNEKVTHYKRIAGYLETYNKYFEIYEKYLSLKGKKKENYKRKHEQEIEAYEYAEIMLENHNVNPDIDLNKVIDLIQNKNEIVVEMTNNYSNLKNKVDTLKEAVKVINDINANRFREMNRNKGLMK